LEQVKKHLTNILVLEYFIEEKGLEVNDKDVTREIYTIADRMQLDGPDAVLKAVSEKMNLDIRKQDFRDFIRKQLVIKKAQEYVIFKEKRSEIQRPTGNEVRQFYTQNSKYFSAPLEINIAHLVIQVPKSAGFKETLNIEKKLSSIRQELLRIKDFEKRKEAFFQKVQTEASERYRKNNGVLGFFDYEKLKSLFPQYLPVAKLDKGGITEMIATEYSRQIVFVLEKKGGETLPLEQVQDRIMQILMMQQGEKVFQSWLEEYSKKYKIVEM
jgi:hypothetical protein